MAIDDFKYLVVIHPAGAGGNHIANLISLCQGVAPRAFIKDYNQYIFKIYEELKIATGRNQVCHPDEGMILQNLQERLLIENADYIKSLKEKFVFTTQAKELYHDYTWTFVFKNLDFSPRKYLLVSYPQNTKLLKRVKTGEWFKGNPDETTESYTKANFPYIDPNDISQIDVDKFVDKNGYEYLQEVLYKNYKLVLDDKYSILHSHFLTFLDNVFA